MKHSISLAGALLVIALSGCAGAPAPTPTRTIPATPTPLPPLGGTTDPAAPEGISPAGKDNRGPSASPDAINCVDRMTEDRHPQGVGIAEEFKIPYEEVMGWFCEGIGFGEVRHGYQLQAETGKPVKEIFELFKSGMGWGKIRAQLGAAPQDDEDGE